MLEREEYKWEGDPLVGERKVGSISYILCLLYPDFVYWESTN
jgi:hypothetical protein